MPPGKNPIAVIKLKVIIIIITIIRLNRNKLGLWHLREKNYIRLCFYSTHPFWAEENKSESIYF